jgi:hypothetical protein
VIRQAGRVRLSRRRLLDLVIVAWLVAIVVWNLPGSPIRDQLIGPVRSVMLTAGLDQNWGVFAPDPRNETWYVAADIDYVDGTSERWDFPDGHWWTGWRDYHWQKLTESAVSADVDRRRAVAAWIGSQRQRPDVAITEVTLLSFRASINGSEPLGPWRREKLAVWKAP